MYVQRFDSRGNKIEEEELNVYFSPTNRPRIASLALLDDSSFVITWNSQENGKWHIYAQKYDGHGHPIGSSQRVNDSTIDSHYHPLITTIGRDRFLITWFGSNQCYYSYDIYGQIYNSKMTRIKDNFLVNTSPYGRQTAPSAISISGGGFVIAWNREHGDDWNIYLQQYDLQCNRVGGEKRVNQTSLNAGHYPVMARLETGGLLVAWISYETGFGHIYAQIYDRSGEQVGGNLRINTDHSHSRSFSLETEEQWPQTIKEFFQSNSSESALDLVQKVVQKIIHSSSDQGIFALGYQKQLGTLPPKCTTEDYKLKQENPFPNLLIGI
jgi:hypothetical protein